MSARWIVLSGMLVGAGAIAESPPGVSDDLSAVRGALEIGVAVSYSQGMGSVGEGVPNVTSTAGAGELLELDVGWRVNPNLLLGAYSTAAKYNPRSAFSGADVWSVTAGLQANWHFLPGTGLDPWLGMGAGYRLYWIAQGRGTDIRQGVDLGRLQIGLDVPLSRRIAVSAFIGVSVSLFLVRQGTLEDSFSSIPGPQLTAFFTGGLLARFDLFGG
jgi:hypothetical protein